jgi:hypothetical protein
MHSKHALVSYSDGAIWFYFSEKAFIYLGIIKEKLILYKKWDIIS